MKSAVCFFALCLIACQSWGAEAQWLTDFPKAQAEAQQEHRLVLMDFTGSDWCPACMELEKNVLSTPQFSNYASTNLILMLVDFPITKRQSAEVRNANQSLQEKYKINGYPTLVLVRPDGKTVWMQDGYGGEPPAELIARLKTEQKKNPF